MRIRVAAVGFRKNDDFMRSLQDYIDEGIESLLHRLGMDIVEEAKHNIGQNQTIDRGQLISSIRILDEIPGKEIIVGTDTPYAEYIEFGRGPVTPKNPDGYLHFFTKDGKEVFTKFSKATEPQPFLEPAVIRHSNRFQDVYVESNEDYLKRNAVNLLDTELL